MERVCVFCGSSPGGRPEYAEAAVELGRELAARGLGLVYGGAEVGLMGTIADAVIGAGGEAIGVIPGSLVDREIAHRALADLRIVGSMHERKATMVDLADGFVALPGGSGTLDELFEAFTWAQLGIHRKPIGILDVCGYWTPLLRFLDHAVEERFLRADHRDALLVEREPAALLDRLDTYEPRAVDKWIDRKAS
jgi:uncharacterized protein (TIGR00730 family)